MCENQLAKKGYVFVDFENKTCLYQLQEILARVYPIHPLCLHESAIDDDQYLLLVKKAKDEIVKSGLIKKLLLGNLNFFIELFGPDIDVQSNIHLRVSRPGLENDFVDWHRDTFNGNSYWEMNIWFPVYPLKQNAGLKVIEGSHLMPSNNVRSVEDENLFRSKVVKGSIANELGFLYSPKTDDFIANRDNIQTELLTPKFGQFIFFFGHLAHRAQNLSDSTRISIDLRVKSEYAPTNTKPGYYQPLTRGSIAKCITKIIELNQTTVSI